MPTVMISKKMVPKGNGITKRCDFVGRGVVLLQEVCPCVGGLWRVHICSSRAQ